MGGSTLCESFAHVEHLYSTRETASKLAQKQMERQAYLGGKPVVLLRGDRHAGRFVSAVVEDPQFATAFHELVAIVVGQEALPVSRGSH